MSEQVPTNRSRYRNRSAGAGSPLLTLGRSKPDPAATLTRDLRATDCPRCGSALAYLQNRYDQICRAVEQTADSVVITNRDGIIEYVNRAFEQTTGYSASEAIGSTPRILKSGRQEPRFYESMWKVLLSGRPFRSTIVNRKKNGELYTAEQTITPMTDANGAITNFVSVLKDITQLLRSKEQEFYLHLAHEIQQRFYRAAAVVEGFDLYGAAQPADETGGDYFDFISGPGGQVTALLGDVSGHGVGAALVMSEARAYCRAFGSMGLAPNELLRCVNDRLHEDLGTRTFVTIAALSLDAAAMSFSFCGGGHVPALLVSRDGLVRKLHSRGLPLGPFADARIEVATHHAASHGDVLVLLTDGITESTSPEGEEFGLDRAAETVVACRGDSAEVVVRTLFERARGHAAGEPQVDDMAAVVCKVQ